MAAVALGLVDSVETKAALKHLQEDGDLRVRIAALASEAGFGGDEAIGRLIEVIALGKGLDASLGAASLRRIPAPVALEISDKLLECCKLNSDVGTRLIESWGWIEADPAHIYAWGLTHDNADIRMQAAWLVGQRHDRGYIKFILPLLKDSDSGVRGMAAWAIVRILGDEYDSDIEA
jgi:hypothetical protein